MVSDGLFFLGIFATAAGLIWWHPPAALVFGGLVMIGLGVSRHYLGGARGKAD